MKAILVLLVLLAGCKKLEEKERHWRREFVPAAVVSDAGVALCRVCEEPRECGKGIRLIADARVEAAFVLGKPVVCDESTNNGVTCWDTQGATVWCPKDLAEPCRTPPPKLLGLPVLPEAPAP
jgi:hypothetical protein